MGYCIHCDNRHGCKSGEPLCLVLMKKKRVRDMRGKDYLRSIRKIDICKCCPYFRACWKEEEFTRATSG